MRGLSAVLLFLALALVFVGVCLSVGLWLFADPPTSDTWLVGLLAASFASGIIGGALALLYRARVMGWW